MSTTSQSVRQSGVEAAAARFGKITVETTRDPDGTIRLRTQEPIPAYPDRVQDHLSHWAKKTPSQRFLAERRPGQEGWASVTYSEAAGQVRQIAAALAERPLSERRPVVILSGNAIEHKILSLGAMTAGVPFAPVSVAYSLVSQDLGKLRHILKLLDPGMVYVSNAEVFKRALTIPEMTGREIVAGAPAAEVKTTPFSELLKGGSASTLADAEKTVGPDSILKFLFTSGSTGIPKGVVTTHRMLNSNLAMLEHMWPFMYARPPVLVDWLPWSHVFGGNHNFGQVVKNGGTLYIDDGKPVPAEIEKTVLNLREISPTIYLNVPKGFELLAPYIAKDDALRKRFFADLEMMFYAGATLPDHLWRTLIELADKERPGNPPSMASSWGLTETAPAALMSNRHGSEIGNIGAPPPGMTLKLVPNGDKLEIRCTGPNVTTGYWNMPEATKEAFDEEGFFITSDAVTFIDDRDASRGFRFNGRTVEDFKLSSGTRVHAAQIWARARQALGTLVFDVVVAAPDRDDIGLMIFPPTNRIIDADYRAQLRAAIQKMNDGVTGSSRVVARAVVLTEPPSLDAGEITDKGSLNSRGIRDRRKTFVDRLYNDSDPDVIRP